MMKTGEKIFVVVLLLASIAGAEVYQRVSSAENNLQEASRQETQVKEVSGYRQWARVNPQLMVIRLPAAPMG